MPITEKTDTPAPTERQCKGDPLGHVWVGVTPMATLKGDDQLCKGCGLPYSQAQ